MSREIGQVEGGFHYQWMSFRDEAGDAYVAFTFVGAESGVGVQTVMDPVNAVRFMSDMIEAVDALKAIATPAQLQEIES